MTQPINILITGQVDHGKSTLIGRLLHECGQMAPEAKEKLDAITKQYGQDNVEWAFALDSLELEREQGITLDASRVWLKRPHKELVLIDVPGHHELLANMLTGASDAQAALMLIDAEEGVTNQTRLHARLTQLLGISQVVAVLTKMDRVDFSEARYNELAKEAAELFPHLQIHTVSISAKGGDNLTTISAQTSWYRGKPLLDYMDAFDVVGEATRAGKPLRMLVQQVVKHQEKRVITGKIISGTMQLGQPLVGCPSGSSAEVKEFITWGDEAEKTSAVAGESVSITLSQPIFCHRGEVLSEAEHLPYFLHRVRASVIWLGQAGMQVGKNYTLRLGTEMHQITFKTDAPLARHELKEVVIRSRSLMVADDATLAPELSRFVVESGSQVVAAGVMHPDAADDQKHMRLARKSENITPYSLPVTSERFEQRNGHKGGVFWMSGLSGSGKSTLAVEMQKLLFDKGFYVVILDGDNIRGGLARDLGFSEEDRTENIRRAAEVARLFAQHGSIVITAFITPKAEDRELAAAICGRYYHPVHVKADVALCESRDVKGLYQKARAGEIQNFTGISAPFDVPEDADITIDTAGPLAECVEQLAGFITGKVALD